MDVLLIYVAGAGLVAAAAAAQGRSGLAWFVIALGVSFILALVLLLVLPVREPLPRLATAKAEARNTICQGCGEAARNDARICRMCKAEFRGFSSSTPPAWLSGHAGTAARECPQCGFVNEPGTLICACGHYLG